MSRRELGIVATVVSSLVVYGLYLVIVFGMYQEGLTRRTPAWWGKPSFC